MYNIKDEVVTKTFEVTPAAALEFADNQHYVVIDYSFSMNLEEYKEQSDGGNVGIEGGTLYLYNLESQTIENFTLWTNDFDEEHNIPQFYVCLPDPEDDDELIDYNLDDDFDIKYCESRISTDVAVCGFINKTDGNFFYFLDSDVQSNLGETHFQDGNVHFKLVARRVFSKINDLNERETFIELMVYKVATEYPHFWICPKDYAPKVEIDEEGNKFIRFDYHDNSVIHLSEFASSPIINKVFEL